MSIYVEREIAAPIEGVWDLTQMPALHQRWDLRFTSIRYLPRTHADDPQEFEYETRLGFGVRIRGRGTTRGERQLPDGTRASSLNFRSSHPLSLIREGSGFWKYTPTPGKTRFVTSYDYETRWGLAGRLLDRAIFRPLMAWATAWSFDSLAQWATRGTPPETSRRLSAANALARLALVAVWLYEGLFPKLLGPHPQEIALSLGAGIPAPWIHAEIQCLGWVEVLVALCLLAFWRRRWPAMLSLAAMVPATIIGARAAPELLSATFNVLVLNGTTAALSIIAIVLLPAAASAANCHWSAFATRATGRATSAPTNKENPYALDL